MATVRVRVPLRRPFATASGVYRERDAWLLRLRDVDGRMGIGEASIEPAATGAMLDRLAAAVRHAAEAGMAPEGLSAVDLAVQAAFDAATTDLALHDHPLAPESVRVNGTIATSRLDATLDAARSLIDRGFDCLKLKVGGEPTMDHFVERLSLVRALIGEVTELRIDANGVWDRATAVSWSAAVGHLGLSYIEQPVGPHDLEGLAWVRHRSPVRVAADESVDSPTGADAVLAADAADVLVVKPARVGGPRAALRIAAAAERHAVPVTVSTVLETGVGLAAAVRCAARLPRGTEAGAHGLATSDLLEHDLLAAPIEVRDGRVAVPTRPIELDQRAVARYAVEWIGW